MVVAGLVVVIALQPADFRVSRTALSRRPPRPFFAQVNDFPSRAAGPGAVYAWVGNREVGEGRMAIVESRPGELVRVRLDFVKPLAGTGVAEFTFRPEGDRSVVTWTMTGEKSFVAKGLHLVMNMDRMIGDQFDKGLAAMKAVAEAAPRS